MFVSVKPSVLPAVIKELQKANTNTKKLFLSIVMGAPLQTLEEVSKLVLEV